MAVSRLGRRSKIIIGAVAVLACLAGFASYLYVRYADVVRFTAADDRVTVDVAHVGKLGTVLVTNKGFALYMYAPDADRRVTCTGGCATAWPPLLVRAGETVAAGPGVRPGLLGTAPNPGGGRVVTYRGWPLYTYLAMPLPTAPPRAAFPGDLS
jgi:predicted lipoprotein with Yx(FWY)xxD motif